MVFFLAWTAAHLFLWAAAIFRRADLDIFLRRFFEPTAAPPSAERIFRKPLSFFPMAFCARINFASSRRILLMVELMLKAMREGYNELSVIVKSSTTNVRLYLPTHKIVV